MSAAKYDLLMPQEHLEALRAVDLHLYFDVHGQPINFEQHGPAVLGVTDAEYQRAAQVVDNLKPERGDVLAQETVGFRSEWHPIAQLNYVRSIAKQSPLIDTEKSFRLVQDSLAETPSDGAVKHNDFYHSDPNRIRALAGEVRRFRIITPPHYTGVLAVAKGVSGRFADASAEELELPQKERNKTPFRDSKMVTRLGSIAASMDIHDPNDPPRLSFTVGDGHAPGVSHILEVIGVPFTQHIQRPGLWGHLAKLARIFSPSSKSPEQKDIDDWIANARRELAS